MGWERYGLVCLPCEDKPLDYCRLWIILMLASKRLSNTVCSCAARRHDMKWAICLCCLALAQRAAHPPSAGSLPMAARASPPVDRGHVRVLLSPCCMLELLCPGLLCVARPRVYRHVTCIGISFITLRRFSCMCDVITCGSLLATWPSR